MDPVRPTSGWPLLRRVLWEQRRGLIAGMLIGLAWSASKVAVPRLTRLAVDRGVIGRESLWFWSGLIAAMAVIAGGRARMGHTLHVPMPGGEIPVEVCSPVFYDPQGARLNV